MREKPVQTVQSHRICLPAELVCIFEVHVCPHMPMILVKSIRNCYEKEKTIGICYLRPWL
jgi:hypothetical protein